MTQRQSPSPTPPATPADDQNPLTRPACASCGWVVVEDLEQSDSPSGTPLYACRSVWACWLRQQDLVELVEDDRVTR